MSRVVFFALAAAAFCVSAHAIRVKVRDDETVRGLRQNVKFGPLDPKSTDPQSFWLGVENPVPVQYTSAPSFPVVPSPGGLPMDILEELYPNGTAKPTGIWQKNLWGFDYNMWDLDTWNAVYPYPYLVQLRNENLNFMYPGAPIGIGPNNSRMLFGMVYAEGSDMLPFPNASAYSWMETSAAYDLGLIIWNAKPQLRGISPLAAQVAYVDMTTNATVAMLYLVKGSPFITFELTGANIAFGSKWQGVPPIIYVNQKPGGFSVTASSFVLEVAQGPAHPQGEYWHAYFDSEVTLQFPRAPMAPINVTQPYTGLLQIAVGTSNDALAGWLNENNGVYATDAQIQYDVDDINNQATTHFVFDVKNRAGNTNELTLLTIPHHAELMPTANLTESPFWCIKGPMQFLTGSTWNLTTNLTTVGFGDLLTVDPAMAPILQQQLNFDYNLYIQSCPGDNITGLGYPGYMNMELYAYVRDISKFADLAIAAEALGNHTMAVSLTQHILDCMKPVLNRTTVPPQECPPPINQTIPPSCLGSMADIYYDTTFGGMVTGWYNRFAPHYCECDRGNPYACEGFNYCDNADGWSPLGNYGNSLYNDHHFQYGYIVRSLAWVIYYATQKNAPLGLTPAQIQTLSQQTLAFARDYANPDSDSDPFFTFLRHKDIYEGHSWAEGYDYSGRIMTWLNQQSGGEAVNAYYAIYLLGLALNDSNTRDWGRIHLASEMQSLSTYQHVSNRTQQLYNIPLQEAVNTTKCMSILFGNGYNGATYYGPNAMFECGITILPITPVTRDFVDPAWAGEAYEYIQWRNGQSGICAFPDPVNNATNICPGEWGPNWWGNEWECCPNIAPYSMQQWRAYPDWYPYMYMILAYNNTQAAWDKLQMPDLTKPTPDLIFPYVNSQGAVVGYQPSLSRTQALFAVATHP